MDRLHVHGLLPERSDLRPVGLPLPLPLQLAHGQVVDGVPAPTVCVPHTATVLAPAKLLVEEVHGDQALGVGLGRQWWTPICTVPPPAGLHRHHHLGLAP